ncbi:hypothetical protein [Bradyrhizobium sp. JYMT SZCCT0180]|uniref:hypothetical protein n=1 Tax=Bradyrhizobium sp. JYMT SZCCT0180 TaxID=2807666 RepID=UPI001BAD0DDB|nr:hypothetical protein [Bradyrhizobium sp. JYMT SZCCT0180]MBR1213398.1 hypothetical protein [Bradyrhizobium sp. JYMT SZCCT0180]
MVMLFSGLCCRHCERSEAIHASARGAMDCFALAMTFEANTTRLIVVDASAIIEL